jgi:hypothetical protein
VWPRASVITISGSAGSMPTNTVYQLPVQRKLATAPETPGMVSAMSR